MLGIIVFLAIEASKTSTVFSVTVIFIIGVVQVILPFNLTFDSILLFIFDLI